MGPVGSKVGAVVEGASGLVSAQPTRPHQSRVSVQDRGRATRHCPTNRQALARQGRRPLTPAPQVRAVAEGWFWSKSSIDAGFAPPWCGARALQRVLAMKRDESPSILVVDDSALMRRLVCRLVEDVLPGASIQEAADGAEAVAVARWLRPDIVVMDLNMPRLGGLDACAALKAQQPAPRVILCTAGNVDASRWRAERVGADFLLQKETFPSSLDSALTDLVAPAASAAVPS
jgi:CheY-like chemotaxis protein